MSNQEVLDKKWQDCGYFALTKNVKVALIKIKNVRYIVNMKDLKDVLDGKLEYAFIFERMKEKWRYFGVRLSKQ